jgi:transposase
LEPLLLSISFFVFDLDILLSQIFVSLTILWTTMRLISHSLQDNIISVLLHSQKSYGQIASELGYSKATIFRLVKKVHHDRENLKGARSKKIISQINTGKAENAVEVTKNLNNIINNHVLTQKIRNILKLTPWLT